MEKNKTKIIIAMGSNVDQKANFDHAREWLEKTFGEMSFSRSVWTEPIGMHHSDKFLNAIAVGYTRVGKEKVNLALKNIERKCGRTAAASHMGSIAMDLDLLLFGEERCHEQDWERDYILELMGELKKSELGA